MTEQLHYFTHDRDSHLFLVSSKYRREMSIPTDLRPRFRAATSVVPVPQNGSSTVPPSGQVASNGRIQDPTG
jgi:hypothetical protein